MINENKIKIEFCNNMATYMPYKIFYSHGMIELLGNYTDRSGGKAIIAAANVGILAYVAAFESKVTIRHLGCEDISFGMDELEVKEEEKGTQIGLTKGILNVMKERGYQIGGFLACIDDDMEAGLQASFLGAYEILICKIVSSLYNKDYMSKYEMVLASHKAENMYFKSNSSALHQVGCAYGGMNYVDFANPDRPDVTPLNFDSTLKFVLVNPGNNKVKVGNAVEDVYEDLKTVAENMFGVHTLREVDPKDVNVVLSRYVPGISEAAKMRTQHFFGELDRVEKAKVAIENKQDFDFLVNLRISGVSMKSYVNCGMVGVNYLGSPAQGLDIVSSCIGDGVAKIHSHGFNGSVLCAVYPKDYSNFRVKVSEKFGDGAITPIRIPAWGAVEVSKKSEE